MAARESRIAGSCAPFRARPRAFLERLKADGRSVVEISKDGVTLEAAVTATAAALAGGPDVVFQGAFLGGAWGGYSDFFERVETPSALGGWSYEVVDTKLKRKPGPSPCAGLWHGALCPTGWT